MFETVDAEAAAVSGLMIQHWWPGGLCGDSCWKSWSILLLCIL